MQPFVRAGQSRKMTEALNPLFTTDLKLLSPSLPNVQIPSIMR